jgi:hypothetical protein
MQKIPKEDHPKVSEQLHRNSWQRILSMTLVLVYALMGWLRYREIYMYWFYFLKLGIWPRPYYFLWSGVGIGAVFSLALVLMIFRASFVPLFVRIAGGLFLAWLWVDRIWLGRREAFFDQLGISILITLATLIIMFVLVRKVDYQKKP